MVLVCFLHVFIAVLDRVIFVRQCRRGVEYDKVFYNKLTGEQISKEEQENAIADNQEHLYDVIYFQKEGINYPLIAKYFLHIIITVFIHFFIFFYLTMMGTYNLRSSVYCEDNKPTHCNDFILNSVMIWFYLLYCTYLYFSGLQLYYGLLDMRKRSLFMRGDSVMHSTLFRTYKAIPFLYELKLTIDWSFTPTALDLWKYIKFENLYYLLFITKCFMKVNNMKKVGESITLIQKVLWGGVNFAILLIILIGPLLLFSSLNPTNTYNPVLDASIELSFMFKINKVTHTLNLFQNNYVDSIVDISESQDYWNTYGYYNSSTTRNFPQSQVQVLSMSNTSDTIWDIARPHIDTIIYRLDNYDKLNFTIALNFKYSFRRNVIIEY
jgi:hypothetical protein